MAQPTRTDEELLSEGIELLSKHLGVTDFVRFIRLLHPGSGDWTAEREQLYGQEAIDAIQARLRELEAREGAHSGEPVAA